MSKYESFVAVIIVNENMEDTIRSWLENHYELGDSAGGSGHLSTTTLEIQETSSVTNKEKIIITVIYEVSTVTEFTYYPDNPPKFIRYSRDFKLDSLGNIQQVHDAVTLATNIGLDLRTLDESDSFP